MVTHLDVRPVQISVEWQCSILCPAERIEPSPAGIQTHVCGPYNTRVPSCLEKSALSLNISDLRESTFYPALQIDIILNIIFELHIFFSFFFNKNPLMMIL